LAGFRQRLLDIGIDIAAVSGGSKVQVVDLSNNPFARPDLEVLVSGLEWIRSPDNNYPIRGTYADKQ
jgi:hypothetical protein